MIQDKKTILVRSRKVSRDDIYRIIDANGFGHDQEYVGNNFDEMPLRLSFFWIPAALRVNDCSHVKED